MDLILLIKFLSACLYPMGLVTLLLLLWILLTIFARKWLARLCLLSSIILMMVFSSPMVASRLVSQLELQYPPLTMDEIKPHDAIVVLGGGLRIPVAPSNRAQLSTAGDRYMYALELYRAKKAKAVFLLGGNVYPQEGLLSEAEYAKQLLVSLGVQEDDIYIETSSRNTQENAKNIASTLKSMGIQNALLVTSSLHMPRAFTWFSELEFRFTPAPADQLYRQVTLPAWRHWLPSSGALHNSTLAMHEYYGLWAIRLSKYLTR